MQIKTRSQIALDSEITRLAEKLSQMNNMSDQEYTETANNLRVLCEAREKKDPASISTELLISVAANLVGVLLVLNFERTGVITSKAMSFLWRK